MLLSIAPGDSAPLSAKRRSNVRTVTPQRSAVITAMAFAMTNMCVDSTARAAFDLGFKVVVHGKACAARPLFGTKLIHRLFLANLGSAFVRIV